MPELPEVETIRASLAPRIAGARILELWTSGKALRLGRPVDTEALRSATVGHRVTGLRRLAKYLVLGTDAGKGLVIHLGMSGRLRLAAAGELRERHAHVILRLDGARELRFVDARRFGEVVAVASGAELALPELARLGIDPLGPELTGQRLHELASGSRRPIKAFLLDQSKVAGIGNIYACEALFEARIHPAMPARRLSLARAEALRRAVVLVLARGLANGGTTLRDYRDALGEKGRNQDHLRVYGREGKPCVRRDGAMVKRIACEARSTFYCPRCQAR